MRPCAPRRHVEWMGDNPPSKRIYFLGLLRVFMALKTLRCCGDSSSPEQRSTLRAINTLNSPKECICKLGGLSPIHLMHRRGAQGLMWGARGPFPLAAAMVVAVVTPVVFCAKATEKRNKNTKISWWLPKSLFITIYVKHIVIHISLIVAWPELELWHGRSPNHYGPMDPGILGIAGNLLSLQE
jgi:hypothetical protein